MGIGQQVERSGLDIALIRDTYHGVLQLYKPEVLLILENTKPFIFFLRMQNMDTLFHLPGNFAGFCIRRYGSPSYQNDFPQLTYLCASLRMSHLSIVQVVKKLREAMIRLFDSILKHMGRVSESVWIRVNLLDLLYHILVSWMSSSSTLLHVTIRNLSLAYVCFYMHSPWCNRIHFTADSIPSSINTRKICHSVLMFFSNAGDGKFLTALWNRLQVLLIGLQSPLIGEDA